MFVCTYMHMFDWMGMYANECIDESHNFSTSPLSERLLITSHLPLSVWGHWGKFCRIHCFFCQKGKRPSCQNETSWLSLGIQVDGRWSVDINWHKLREQRKTPKCLKAHKMPTDRDLINTTTNLSYWILTLIYLFWMWADKIWQKCHSDGLIIHCLRY